MKISIVALEIYKSQRVDYMIMDDRYFTFDAISKIFRFRIFSYVVFPYPF